MKKFLLAICMSLIATVAMADEFEEGVHFREILEKQPTRTGDKVEVLELFWYACPHCYKLAAPLQKWLPGMSNMRS